MLKHSYAMKTEPYQHQRDALDFAYGRKIFGLFLPPGLGKTKIIIDLAATYYMEDTLDAVLYIGPNGVQRQTLEEQFPEHCAVPTVPFLFKTGNDTKRYKAALTDFFHAPRSRGLKVFAANVESFSYDTYLALFRMYLKTFRTFLVVDEAQTIANPSAHRTRNISYALGDMLTVGKRVMGVTPYSAYRAVLTGTPVTQSPFAVWSMAEFLQHNFFGLTYSAFCSRYGLQRTDYVPRTSRQFRRTLSLREILAIRANQERGVEPASTCAYFGISNDDYLYILQHPEIRIPYKNLPELRGKIQSFSFSRRVEDCLDLPPKIFTRIMVDMTSEQREVYSSLSREMIAEYGGQELSVLSKLALITRLSQVAGGFFPGTGGEPTLAFAQNAKIEALLSDLADIQVYPIIVLTRFVLEAKAVTASLKKAYPDLVTELVYSGVKGKARDDILQRYKQGEVQFLVATIDTVGIGFNLQRASLTYFFSNSYSRLDREQAEDRTRRSGQLAETVVYKDLIMRGTVDERIYRILQSGKDLADYMQSTSLEEFIGGDSNGE